MIEALPKTRCSVGAVILPRLRTVGRAAAAAAVCDGLVIEIDAYEKGASVKREGAAWGKAAFW